MHPSDKSLSEVHESVRVPEKQNRWRTFMSFIGPAYLVSVGYMDPGNWATDIAGGSKFGYSLIWVLLMSNLMALLLQSLAARLGVVKGWDLAQASRQQFGQWANFSLYAFAEIAIAACDLAEIIGMAIGLNLLFHLPLLYGILITAFDTFLLLLLINKGIRKLELFIVSMVSIIGLSFIAQLFIVKPDSIEIMKGFVPSALSGDALYIAIGIIGATVMPHNLYLHSSLVQTRKFRKDNAGIKAALRYNFFDLTIALNLAFFVNAAILILAASAFFTNGFHQISDIKDAHVMLNSLFGSLAPTLFAIALICSGQSSTITGTLAGQIVMEGYLNLRISPWLRRTITRLIAIIPALFTILYYGEEKLGALLILSQVVLSLQLGFAIVPLIHFTSNQKIMGEFAISKTIKYLAWLVAIIIISLNVKLVLEEISSFIDGLSDSHQWLEIPVLLVVLFAALLLLYIIFQPLIIKFTQKTYLPHGSASRIEKIESFTYNKIAITLDFSDNDKASIQHALAVGGINAEYLLIHIVESVAATRYGGEVMDNESLEDLYNINEYKKNLVELGYKAETILGYGRRAKNIAEISKEHNIELLVMGAHGHAALKDFIFGSTVDAVRHLVSIPVLVVRV